MSSATSVCPFVCPGSRAPIERCTFWRSVYCGSARSHHQQAALQTQQPRSIEYAWRNVGEMTSPFYSTPSAGLSVLTNTSNKLYSTILSSPLLHTYRQSTLRWLSNSAKSDSPLRLNISATHSVSLEVSWSCEVRLIGITRCPVKTRLEAGSGGFVFGLWKLILPESCFISNHMTNPLIVPPTTNWPSVSHVSYVHMPLGSAY